MRAGKANWHGDRARRDVKSPASFRNLAPSPSLHQSAAAAASSRLYACATGPAGGGGWMDQQCLDCYLTSSMLMDGTWTKLKSQKVGWRLPSHVKQQHCGLISGLPVRPPAEAAGVSVRVRCKHPLKESLRVAVAPADRSPMGSPKHPASEPRSNMTAARGHQDDAFKTVTLIFFDGKGCRAV
ncbi:unnamed protein product [Pleuronectes platessa]|uniref:Uncharacterized protein n=1 Tax=Pleuronectes platessa TaxID=8262 RepID=A0A9N7UIL1_PLEPL|nr:unnamed protein product [Pleuronectes platessa]